jgi:hypothetical protein
MTLRPVAVGDYVAWALSVIGVSRQRVEKWLRIPPDDCGCSARQSALNAWGFRVQYRIIMFAGGPGDVPWRERLAIVQGRLYRIWKTTTSK